MAQRKNAIKLIHTTYVAFFAGELAQDLAVRKLFAQTSMPRAVRFAQPDENTVRLFVGNEALPSGCFWHLGYLMLLCLLLARL